MDVFQGDSVHVQANHQSPVPSWGPGLLGDATGSETLKLIASYFDAFKPVDKEQVKQDIEGKDGSSTVDRTYKALDPKKIISKEEFENLSSSKENEKYIMVETPQEDARIIEQLLEIPRGTIPTTFVGFKTEESMHCPNCSRHYSFLDKLNTGLAIHSKQFLKDLIMGTHGYVRNTNPPQMHSCYNCGVPGIVNFGSYKTPTYSCQTGD